MKITSLLASLFFASAFSSASALTFAFSETDPVPGPSDAYNFSGAANDASNVNDGGFYPDGQANDRFTYVAGDRPNQGQTFTTGSHSKGYIINAIWVRHVGYTNNAAPTFWEINPGGKITVRVTDPIFGGSDHFVLHAETYYATGKEGWANTHTSKNGSGIWLKFTFSKPVVLSPDKTYGFDLSSPGHVVFEWLGTCDSDAYIGGGAYNGNTPGVPDSGLNGLKGDRVFLVELAECN